MQTGAISVNNGRWIIWFNVCGHVSVFRYDGSDEGRNQVHPVSYRGWCRRCHTWGYKLSVPDQPAHGEVFA